MTAFDPTPRPALRRAPDAAAHPTAPAGTADQPPRAFAGVTSDAIAKPEKTAKLKVQVPKSLKAGLEDEAARTGTSVDAIVVRALRAR